MLDVKRLQMLRTVAREGSLSAAARELGYTQPAVSHHIAKLEAEVGTALLTRLGRGIQLTDAGAALVEHAEAVMSRLDAAAEEVAAIAGLRAGRVRLAAFPSASATLMVGALSRLRERHPGIAVTFTDAEPEDAYPLLRAGELDLVLAFSYAGDHDGRDLTAVPLLRDPTLAVLPAGSGEGPIAIAELADETWIAGCERCRRHLLSVCDFEPRIEFATDDYMTVQSLIAAGLGVSLLPALALRASQRPGSSCWPIKGDPARTIEAVVLTAERRPPAVTAMLEALREAAHALVADAENRSLDLSIVS